MENSYRDFHVKGVDYLCLHRTPELTIKVYNIPADVDGYRDRLLVAPHSHAYNFTTHVLRGHLTNVMFFPDTNNAIRPWRRWYYQSGFPDAPKLRPSGYFAFVARHYNYYDGQGYYMSHDQIHSIHNNRTEVTMVLFQYHTIRKTTRTYLWGQDQMSFDGLYTRWKRRDIVDAMGELRVLVSG